MFESLTPPPVRFAMCFYFVYSLCDYALLFDLTLYVPVNISSVMSGRVFLGFNQYEKEDSVKMLPCY